MASDGNTGLAPLFYELLALDESSFKHVFYLKTPMHQR